MNQPLQQTTAPLPQALAIGENAQSREILAEYADVRWQIATLEAKLKEIEPIAVRQALTILENQETANGKRVIYRTDTVDIVLQLRSTKPKPEEYAELESLKELIDMEATKAQRQNREAIALTEQEISRLQANLTLLKQTDLGLQYLQQYVELEAQLTTLKPLLSVKLK
ncbi:MAG: hypothetical protein N5P05_004119 (plasmid) [Chroococcopsis gigantea SAG 12.99]|nr:hypothetical protein [Chroococcopsis gigantea SAG 12.99]